MEFYTYIYYDPSRNNEPIYVGKGKGGRAWAHLTRKDTKHIFISRLIHMRNNGVQPIIGIYAGLDEEFAFFLEEELIAKFGRKQLGTGPLLNKTDGGEGGKGAVLSDETRNKLKMAWLGKKHSAEAKAKMSRHVKSDEHRRNLSKANKGRKGWNLGMKMPEGYGKPISEAMIGREVPDEVRQKISETLKGRKLSDEVKENMRLAWVKRKALKNGNN